MDSFPFTGRLSSNPIQADTDPLYWGLHMAARTLARIMSRFIFGLLCCLTVGIRPTVAAADLGTQVTFDIPAQQLPSALLRFAAQSGVQITSPGQLIEGKDSAGVIGTLDGREALQRILKGTALRFDVVDENTVMIVPVATQPAKAEVAEPGAKPKASRQSMQTTDGAQKRSFWDRFRISQADTSGSVNSPQPVPTADSDSKLAEIVVTATKRAENILDVPLSITAITAEEIDRRGFVNSEDYLRGIPGANQVDSPNGQTIIIRGMETSPLNQNFGAGVTTATYFGETPTTNTAGLGSGTNIDLKLVDIERVEVLRGPQGTSFGNSSMGGAVRTIPVAPKLDAAGGKIAAGYSNTSGPGSDNYNVQVIGNLPLIQDRLAIRIAGYQYQDSGYYRNRAGSDTAFREMEAVSYGAQTLDFASDKNDIGASEVRGGRVTALFQATDDLKFTLGYLSQKTEIDGMQVASSGGYRQTMLQVAPEHLVRGQKEGVADADIDIANATMEYDLGWANVLATYSHTTSGSIVAQPYQLYGFSFPLSFFGDSDHRENVGEIRLATQLDGAWNFLAGVYVEKLEDATVFDYYWVGDPARNFFDFGERFTGNYSDQRRLKQKAAFGEASWEILPRLTLTAGVRAYDYDRSVRTDQFGGLFNPPAPTTHIGTNNDADASGTTFRGNLSYKVNDDALVYAGWSQGFRLGKPQPGLPQCDGDGDGIVDGTGVSVDSTRSVSSDDVDSYELGGKFALLDRRLRVDAAIFRMDWSNIPVTLLAGTVATGCGLTYVTNAGTARSEGVEVQANFQLTAPLRIDFGGSWNKAELTEEVAGPVLFESGDRLPGAPRMNANLGLQYEFKLGAYEAFLRADSIYVGSFYGDIPQSPNLKTDDYVKVDASARVAIGKLNVDLFVRNLTNEDAFTFRGASNTVGDFFGYRLRPRTVGLQLAYAF